MNRRMSMQEHAERANQALAYELRKLGQPAMADAAASGHYSDFGSPLPAPKMALANDLQMLGTYNAMALRERVIKGEFDG